MIGTLPRGIGIDARRRRTSIRSGRRPTRPARFIHIHPSFDAGDMRVNDFGLANGARPHHRRVDRRSAADLCRSYRANTSNVKFFAPMGAAGLPFVLGRLKRNTRSRPASAIRSRRLPRSIPTRSCTTRAFLSS